MSDITPTDAELIRRALDSRMADVFTALPGVVESFDDAAKTADVRVALHRVLPDDEGTLGAEELPVLKGVPVLFPRSANFRLAFRLAAGDGVLLVFSKWATGEWRATGNPSAPGDLREHSVASPVAIPGWFPDTSPMGATGEQMGKPGGPAIHFGLTTISVGGGSHAVALADAVEARLQALELFAATHVHLSSTPGNATSTAPFTADTSDVASSALKTD
jgi:hypothetical protein